MSWLHRGRESRFADGSTQTGAPANRMVQARARNAVQRRGSGLPPDAVVTNLRGDAERLLGALQIHGNGLAYGVFAQVPDFDEWGWSQGLSSMVEEGLQDGQRRFHHTKGVSRDLAGNPCVSLWSINVELKIEDMGHVGAGKGDVSYSSKSSRQSGRSQGRNAGWSADHGGKYGSSSETGHSMGSEMGVNASIGLGPEGKGGSIGGNSKQSEGFSEKSGESSELSFNAGARGGSESSESDSDSHERGGGTSYHVQKRTTKARIIANVELKLEHQRMDDGFQRLERKAKFHVDAGTLNFTVDDHATD